MVAPGHDVGATLVAPTEATELRQDLEESSLSPVQGIVVSRNLGAKALSAPAVLYLSPS
jgi:hypothetical protein